MSNGGKDWTAEDRELLLVMRRKKKTWVDIGAHFEVSATAARLQYFRLMNPGAKEPEHHANIRWIEEENRELIARVDGGEDIGEIAASLMRTRWACIVQYHALKRGERPITPTPMAVVFKAARERKGEAVQRSLDTRAEHQSLTAAFFGDPLPGRSALDQKRLNS